LNQQLSVVLPMYNNERQLRSTVHDLLDVSVMIRTPINLVIVDDGSTDDTFETACELARMYPQVQALRQTYRGGLGSVLNLVRNRLQLEMVIVHDGVTPIDPMELKQLLIEQREGWHGRDEISQPFENFEARGSRRFAAVRALQQSMEQAHRSVAGFNWLRLEKPLIPRRRAIANLPNPATPVLGNLPTSQYLTQLPTGLGNPRMS
jgi:glycosyltransferase involved in cell wall biosynthesis